jgi:hypothetical protein
MAPGWSSPLPSCIRRAQSLGSNSQCSDPTVPQGASGCLLQGYRPVRTRRGSSAFRRARHSLRAASSLRLLSTSTEPSSPGRNTTRGLTGGVGAAELLPAADRGGPGAASSGSMSWYSAFIVGPLLSGGDCSAVASRSKSR